MILNMIIPNNTVEPTNFMVQYLPLLIAIIAGFIAIIQIRLNHNAQYRLKWIEGFRNAVSILISEVNDYSVTLTKIISDEIKGITDKNTKDAEMIRFYDAVKSSTRYFNEVLLFLDPKNKRHQEIIERIKVIETACNDSSPKIEDFTKSIGQHFESLIILAQNEISEQWRKSQKWII